MGTKKMPRNGLVDIMRLLFAGIVVRYHFYSNGTKHFPSGRLGVEFFAILAGLLMFSAWDQKGVAKLALEERQNYWLNYMKKRYVRFFWYNLIAFIFVFFAIRIWRDRGNSIGGILIGDIWELLLIKMNGLNQGDRLLNVPAWTLSCMLVFFERQFLAFLMPLSVISGIGYWVNMTNNDYCIFLTFFTAGMLRIYLWICCGIFSYWICKKLKTFTFSRVGCVVLSIVELLGYVACVLIVFHRFTIHYQVCFVLIATFVLALSFSRLIPLPTSVRNFR